nr:hypothetical protein [Tanacetum cinerariifolium]
MILESVEHDPLIWPTIEENEAIRTNKYVKLSVAEKIQADCDMKETNITLQGEGYMARQCSQPKRSKNVAWYKKKAMLTEAQEAEQILDEVQLAFLTDLGVPDGQAVQIIILNNVAFQTVDLDTYDFDYDDILNTKFSLPTFPFMGNIKEAKDVTKAISLLRQAIGSSPREKSRTTKPKSTK